MNLEKGIMFAQSRGLDAICLTDHGTNRIQTKAARLSQVYGLPIFVGVEISTQQGDILVYGLESIPERTFSAQDLLAYVQEYNAIAVAAHPFRRRVNSLGSLLRTIEGLGGVEAFNGNTDYEHNLLAYHIGQERGLPCLGGSDAHAVEQVGRFATHFPDGIKNIQDLIHAIRTEPLFPVYYNRATRQFEKIEV
jgi:hypothetical protein